MKALKVEYEKQISWEKEKHEDNLSNYRQLGNKQIIKSWQMFTNPTATVQMLNLKKGLSSCSYFFWSKFGHNQYVCLDRQSFTFWFQTQNNCFCRKLLFFGATEISILSQFLQNSYMTSLFKWHKCSSTCPGVALFTKKNKKQSLKCPSVKCFRREFTVSPHSMIIHFIWSIWFNFR